MCLHVKTGWVSRTLQVLNELLQQLPLITSVASVKYKAGLTQIDNLHAIQSPNNLTRKLHIESPHLAVEYLALWRLLTTAQLPCPPNMKQLHEVF